MNRRDFLKIFGLSLASTLLPVSVIDADALDAPVTDESPLAYVTIDGEQYVLVSFYMSLTTDWNYATTIDVSISFKGRASAYSIIAKGYTDFAIDVPGVKATFSGRIVAPSRTRSMDYLFNEIETIDGEATGGLSVSINP